MIASHAQDGQTVIATSPRWAARYRTIYGALTGLIPTTAAGESGLVLRRVVRVGLNHSVADQPSQRSIVERAQTKKRRLALCARLGAHHLMAASSKNHDASRQQPDGGRFVHR